MKMGKQEGKKEEAGKEIGNVGKREEGKRER